MDRLPEEWLEDRALLARRMSTDAPMGDIDLDEQEWDADRVRQLWNTPSPIWAVESVVRHVPSGRLVGFTDIVVRPGSPRLGVQTDTLVLREHRGHALGLAVKVANLRALQREKPEVTLRAHVERRHQRAHDCDQRADGLPTHRLVRASGPSEL